MTLLESLTEPFVILNKSTVSDGYGGYKTIYAEGARFGAAVSVDQSTEALTAQAQGVTAIYTVMTNRAMNLQYHDVIKRKSDGKIFRITSDGDDNKTPPIATLDMRSVRAEEWSLPIDGE